MVVTGTYHPYLVALSILVASLASYTALDLGGHVGAARGLARKAWLVAAAITMGGSSTIARIRMADHFAAFSFVIMMFNLPLPGGTTGHAVGVGIAVVVLGPWAAMLAISIALVIQALFFGDGGITAIGANCSSGRAGSSATIGWLDALFFAKITTPN